MMVDGKKVKCKMCSEKCIPSENKTWYDNEINDKWRNAYLGTWLDMGKHSGKSGTL
jgi:hypothetical protein